MRRPHSPRLWPRIQLICEPVRLDYDEFDWTMLNQTFCVRRGSLAKIHNMQASKQAPFHFSLQRLGITPCSRNYISCACVVVVVWNILMVCVHIGSLRLGVILKFCLFSVTKFSNSLNSFGDPMNRSMKSELEVRKNSKGLLRKRNQKFSINMPFERSLVVKITPLCLL